MVPTGVAIADHTQPSHFLDLVVGVGDDPVAADQLRGDAAGIRDGNGIGEDISAAIRIRLLGDVSGAGRYIDLIFFF